MSSFECEYCKTLIHDSPAGYITGCEHYPIERLNDRPIDPPDGCIEITGIILVIEPGKSWVTLEGYKTTVFAERGVWPTLEEAEMFRDSLPD